MRPESNKHLLEILQETLVLACLFLLKSFPSIWLRPQQTKIKNMSSSDFKKQGICFSFQQMKGSPSRKKTIRSKWREVLPVELPVPRWTPNFPGRLHDVPEVDLQRHKQRLRAPQAPARMARGLGPGRSSEFVFVALEGGQSPKKRTRTDE